MPITYSGLFSGFDLEEYAPLQRLSIGLRYYKTSGLFSQPYLIFGAVDRVDKELPQNSLERSNIGEIWREMNTRPIITEIMGEFMAIDIDNERAVLAGGRRLRRYIDPLITFWPPSTNNLDPKDEARFDELFEKWRRKHGVPNIAQPMDPRINRAINTANEQFTAKAVADAMVAKKRRLQLAARDAARESLLRAPTNVFNHAFSSGPGAAATTQRPLNLPVLTVYDHKSVRNRGRATKVSAKAALNSNGKRAATSASTSVSPESAKRVKLTRSAAESSAQAALNGNGKRALTSEARSVIVSPNTAKKIKATIPDFKPAEFENEYKKGLLKNHVPALNGTEQWSAGDKTGSQRHTPLKKKGEVIVDDGNIDFSRPVLGVVDVSKLRIRLITTAKCPKTGKTIPGAGVDRLYGRTVDWNNKGDIQALDKWRALCHSRDFGAGWKQRPARWLQSEKHWLLNFMLDNSKLGWTAVCVAYNKKFGGVVQEAGQLYVQAITYDDEVMASARKGPIRKVEDMAAVSTYWPEYQTMVATSAIRNVLCAPPQKPVVPSPATPKKKIMLRFTPSPTSEYSSTDPASSPENKISTRKLYKASSSQVSSSPNSASTDSTSSPRPRLKLKTIGSKSNRRSDTSKVLTRTYDSSSSDISEEDDESESESEEVEEPEDDKDRNYRSSMPKSARR